MFGIWRPAYQKVEIEQDDGGEPDKDRGNSRSSLFNSRALLLLVIICSILLGLALFASGASLIMLQAETSPDQKGTTTRSPPCGNSSAEALARGCSFDQLSLSWLPQHCPHYANEDFLGAGATAADADPQKGTGAWTYYIDPVNRIPASEADWANALDNKLKLYGERGEHLSHCIFMFRSLGLIFRDGGRYTSSQVTYEHVHHCTEYLLEAVRRDPDWKSVETVVENILYNVDC